MKYNFELIVNVSFFIVYLCPFAETEVYTAIADLERLLSTNWEIIKALDSYLALEEERLRNLSWLKDEYEKIYIAALQDEESFLTNPVNAFVLMKRLSQDWRNAGHMIDEEPGKAVVQNVTSMDLPFPDQEDLKGAATALLRLQDTYRLNTSQLARGEIAGAKSKSSELTAGDCFQLGFQAIALSDCKRAIQWLQEALIRVEREEIKTADKPFVLELLAHCSFKLNNVKHAIKLTRHIIETAPEYSRAAENLIHYESILKAKGDATNLENGFDGDYNFYSEYEESDKHDYNSLREYKRASVSEFENYEKLCRGERTRFHRVESQLRCRYTTNGNSYFLLQPVKQEILNLDPFICIYHDIISDRDIELFKAISLPRLQSSVVTNPKTGLVEIFSDRVSKSAWLHDKIHPRIAHASEFLKELTGLETSTAEELHVINYGIGGHYEPHYDFKREGEADGFARLGTGNRIATWIFYLSDVDAGGATVFPKIGVSVKPKKGSAAFWYNLRKSGAGDLNTLHAGCPVLSGSKWVGNKWFHELKNEFRRKCSSDPQE